MFLLDTNVISELLKIGDGRAHAGVTAWIAEQDAETLFVSALTITELEIGVLRMERRDPGQGRRLRARLDEKVVPEFADRTLPVDSTVALRCARLHRSGSGNLNRGVRWVIRARSA